LGCHKGFNLTLFSRDVGIVEKWLRESNASQGHCVKDYSEFTAVDKYDAIINFIGVGDPAKAKSLGSSILDLTYKYDNLILSYLTKHLTCKYIFLSSGAVYGTNFDVPIGENSYSKIEINSKNISDWYCVAKLYAEFRHRAYKELPIVDLRVFNYFSPTQNMNSRFLIAEAYRAIRDGNKIETSSSNIVRDYLSPRDFFSLILAVLNAPIFNGALDCFTKSPIDKFSLLGALNKRYGLNYEILADSPSYYPDEKKCYYSLNKVAKLYGYEPSRNSLENIFEGFDRLISYK
jgi:nucleoside-diphosphate-sugar epimerase